ncbi:DUF1566 domain-containing protein [Candidatus Binatia bacterium]|nr:DUF1566 domain-containing protein [Candidatus Binatia bacterium]
MPRRPLYVLIALMGFAPSAHAAPTPQQLCESAMELASAKYAQCRLNAESKYSKTGDAAKRTAALTKCSTNLGSAFTKATDKYGAACTATEPSSAFDDYLKQCSDDATAAAGGATLPDYVGDLASCNADLTTCSGDLATCNGDLTSCDADLTTCDGDLATCSADLTTTAADLAACEGNLAACEALPLAPLLRTGQTTSYGPGTDGNLQIGVAHGFVDNGDGTITDTRTGLMWEKKSDDGSIHDKDNIYTWSTGSPWNNTGTAFTTFLATLNSGGGFAGYTDWRLPNRKELESLVNLQAVNPWTFAAFKTACAPACTVVTCSCTVSSDYWSSSSYSDPSIAWYVGFSSGGVLGAGKTAANYVRAVRTGS